MAVSFFGIVWIAGMRNGMSGIAIMWFFCYIKYKRMYGVNL